MSPMQRLEAYLSGFIRGVGAFDRLDGADEDWNRGWFDGRKAWKAASKAERERLGMPPSRIVRPATEGSK